MYLYSNLTVILNRPQSLQMTHALLIFISILTLTTIVYIYQWKVANLSTVETNILALKIDRSAEPSFEEKFANLTMELPSLPLEFIQRNGYRRFKISKACARFPDIFALEFHNNFWQTYTNGKSLVRLYGAYYDNRLLDHNVPVVRILVMINKITSPEPNDFCQIWFEYTTKPIIVRIDEYKPIWQSVWTKSSKLFYPYMITCVLPAQKKYALPKAVSLVRQPCENAANVLKIYYEAIKDINAKQTFGVCVKGLSHPISDLSLNLIEWLEMLYKLGISKVYFNIYDVHPNVQKVLNYYKNLHFVDFKFTTIGNMAIALPILQHILLENDQRNRRLHDAILEHDCFYQNLYNFDYIALLDIDLVPMPFQMFNSWHGVLSYVKRQSTCNNITRICLRNVPNAQMKNINVTNVENDDVPTFLSDQISDMRYFLDNATYISCWHNTNFRLLMDDQFLGKSNDCSFKLKPHFAQLQHYQLKNEQQVTKIQNSKLTGLCSLVKQRTEEVAKLLNLH